MVQVYQVRSPEIKTQRQIWELNKVKDFKVVWMADAFALGGDEVECRKCAYWRDAHDKVCNAVEAENERLKKCLRSIRVQAVVNGIEGHEDIVERINKALGE